MKNYSYTKQKISTNALFNISALFTSAILLFSACQDKVDNADFLEYGAEQTDAHLSTLLGIPVMKSANMLSFETKEDFYKAAENFSLKLNSYTENEDGLLVQNVIETRTTGFQSLYDEFCKAMEEAEDYCDTEEGYYQFKTKYSSLYFPEEGDDISAYLPVSDESVARLVNSMGEVMIAGETVNMRDVFSYEDLRTLGLLEPEENEFSAVTKSSYPLNELPTVKINNRKMWVKCGIKPDKFPYAEKVVVQVCFRKKGAFGAWYNYKSVSTLGWHSGGRGSDSRDKASSHDYEFKRVYNNGNRVPVKGIMYVDFRGFGSKGERQYFEINK